MSQERETPKFTMPEPSSGRSHWPILILSSSASLITAILPIFLVRILTVEEIGIYKIFFVYLTIIPGLSMVSGLLSGLGYWSGQKEAQAALQASAAGMLALAVALPLLALAFADSITGFMDWEPLYTTVFAFALFGVIASSFFEEAAIATGRVWLGAGLHSGFELIRALVVLGAALVTRDLGTVLIAYAVVSAFKVITTYIIGIKIGIVGLKWSPAILRAVGTYAVPVSLAWIFGIVIDKADQLILSTTISKEEFALYASGCLLIPPLFAVEQSITRVLIPQLSELFATGNSSRAARLYREAVENLGFILLPAVMGLVIFAAPIIEILFTPAYGAAAVYLHLFALTYLVLIIPYDAVPRAKGRAPWILRTFIIFSSLSALAALGLSSVLGATGALLGVLISKLLMRVYAIWHIRLDTGWRFKEFLPLPELRRLVLLCLVLGFFAVAAYPAFTSDIWWFLTCAPLFCLLYFPLAVGLKARAESNANAGQRVMLLTQSLPIGGLERMVFDLSTALESDGQWQPFVCVYDQDSNTIQEGLIPLLRQRGISVLLHRKPGGFSFLTPFWIAKVALRYRILVIHSHNLGPLIYGILAKVVLLGRVRLIHTQHSLLHLRDNPRYLAYERFFSRFADKIALVAPEMVENYRAWGINSGLIEVIPNGIPVPSHPPLTREKRLDNRDALLGMLPDSKVRRVLQAERSATWILYLARVHPVKGQLHAIDVWESLAPQDRERCFMIFVGPEAHPGALDVLRARIAAAKDSSRVLIVGPTHNPSQWLDAADVFLSCSEFEGLPLAPLEAICRGVRAICSDIPGHRFLMAQARLFNLNRPEDAASEIHRFMNQLNEGELSKLPRDGFDWVQSQYSVEQMMKRYKDLYGR